jgi:tetraacyldisaccharide 4'-kinase
MPVEDVWYGRDLGSRLLRGALAPAAWGYKLVMRARNALYDTGVFRTVPPPLPALSVGNLSVGGTGKTPVAAWLAQELLARGARPGVVLRGYGGDEERVHRLLTPGATVVADADRIRGVASAAAAGCDVAVLDDAFQHRRVGRVVDLVLVSADVPWVERCLPAGPLREPPASLRRASLLLVTCKTASVDEGAALGHRLARDGTLPLAVATLGLASLVAVHAPGRHTSLDAVRNTRMLLVTGIGNPKALQRQLESYGAAIEPAVFPDHHRFSRAEVAGLEARASALDGAICTLKDAVKLRGFWTDKGPPLMYVSQRLELPLGVQHVHAALDRLLAARSPTRLSTAG